ncbi:MAG: TIGR00282 family metallophosphoesterase [bacterium]|nr:TIGR00282 family metallophosphoesterase [bacterium]
MKILFIGDIIGTPGKEVVIKKLPTLIKENTIDFVIANAECVSKSANSITPEDALLLTDSGVNCITTGERVWGKQEMIEFLTTNSTSNSTPVQCSILRPLNYPHDVPGIGSAIYPEGIAVINLLGRAFLANIDCPFRTGLAEIEKISSSAKIIIVDFHAQTTAEKQAFSYWIEGKVSAVIGTHTTAQTNDEKIMSGGTAYISSVGMTGVQDSISGMVKELYVQHFITGIPVEFKPAQGEGKLNGVIIEIDNYTGKAVTIRKISGLS